MIGWIQDGEMTYEVAVSHEPGAHRLSPRARLHSGWLARDPCNVEVMRAAVLEAEPGGLGHRHDGFDLATAFEDLLSAGRIELRPASGRPLATVFPRADRAEPEEVEALVELAKEHFIEFRFVDPRGNPISGVPCRLHDPAGDQTQGTLGRDGRIRRDRVPDGTWAAELCAVEDVRWDVEEASCDDSVVLRARVLGCPDGTNVTIRVFREYAETDDDVIEELSATVSGQAIEASWTYDYAADDRRAAEQGQARFVAEVAVDDTCWAKTLVPVRVALQTIEAADWSCGRCERGADVQLTVEVSGYADGAAADVSIVRRSPDGTAEEYETVGPLSIVDGRCETGWTVPETDGEFRFKVALDEGVPRTAESDWLWVTGGWTGRLPVP